MADLTKKIIANVLRYLDSNGFSMKKIVIQKSLFFLKDFGLPIRVKFVPYLYGPYSKDLSNAIDEMIFWDEIKETEDCYEIKNLDDYEPISAVSTGMDKVKTLVNNDLGFINLELYSTGLYCFRALDAFKDSTDISTFIEEFKAWKKEKFPDDKIEECYENLKSKWLS